MHKLNETRSISDYVEFTSQFLPFLEEIAGRRNFSFLAMINKKSWIIGIDEAVRKRGTLSQEVACYFRKIATTLTAPVRREVHTLYY